MARVDHQAQIPLGSVGDYSVADAADITFQVGDDPNEDETKIFSGKTLVFVRNPEGQERLIVIPGVADPYGRTTTINYNLPANGIAMFGPFDEAGWAQANGKLFLNTIFPSTEYAVLRLP